MDMNMPGIGGLEATKKILANCLFIIRKRWFFIRIAAVIQVSFITIM
jgi:CheY-like chemotaxis protein